MIKQQQIKPQLTDPKQDGNSDVKVTQPCPTLQPHGLYNPWNSLGQNTGVGSCSLQTGILLSWGVDSWFMFRTSLFLRNRILILGGGLGLRKLFLASVYAWELKEAECDMELDIRLELPFGKKTVINFTYLFIPCLIPKIDLNSFQKYIW